MEQKSDSDPKYDYEHRIPIRVLDGETAHRLPVSAPDTTGRETPKKKGRPATDSKKLYFWAPSVLALAVKMDAESRGLSLSERLRGVVADEMVRIGRMQQAKNAITAQPQPATVNMEPNIAPPSRATREWRD